MDEADKTDKADESNGTERSDEAVGLPWQLSGTPRTSPCSTPFHVLGVGTSQSRRAAQRAERKASMQGQEGRKAIGLGGECRHDRGGRHHVPAGPAANDRPRCGASTGEQVGAPATRHCEEPAQRATRQSGSRRRQSPDSLASASRASTTNGWSLASARRQAARTN